jgi:hypothetical protein
MKKILLHALLCFGAFQLTAQYEFSTFTNTGHGGATTFATDYQATGINPANLGWDFRYSKYHFAMGFNEFTGSVHSTALQKQELRDLLGQTIQGNFKDFTREQKIQAAKKFADEGFAINADYGAFGFGFITKHAGGFAVHVNDRFQWYSKLGPMASDLLFLGKTSSYFNQLMYLNPLTGVTSQINNYENMSPDSIKNIVSGITTAPKKIGELLNGSELTLSWTREWNVSYGRRIFGDSTFSMYGGIGLKYMQGTGYMSVKSENNKLTAISSLSPSFNIDYGAASQMANAVTGRAFPPKTVGSGFGMDFGLNVIIKNFLEIGASFINAGSITWKGNVYEVRDTFLMSTTSAGMNNYNIPGNLANLMGDGGLMKLVGQKEIKTRLPGMGRFGASIVIKKVAEIGMDMIFPFNEEAGNFKKPVIGFGGDIFPFKWLKLQAGYVTGGNYDYSVPIGIIFVGKDGNFEGGIASRDAVTFFTQNGPTLSLSIGFMRFRF